MKKSVFWWPVGGGFWESEYAYTPADAQELIIYAKNHRDGYLVVYDEDGEIVRGTGVYDRYFMVGREVLGEKGEKPEPRLIDGEWYHPRYIGGWYFEKKHHVIKDHDAIISYLRGCNHD